MQFNYKVYWESYLKSDRLKIKDRVLCAGWANIKASNPKDAASIWLEMFPKDKVVKVD